MKDILVVTIYGDIHAAAFQHCIHKHCKVKCRLLEVDSLGLRDGVAWKIGPQSAPQAVLIDTEGNPINVEDIGLVWWRRYYLSPRLGDISLSPEDLELVGRDTGASILGSFLTTYTGVWVNDPISTTNAENKLVQLSAARKAGFRIPDTLVSNIPSEVRSFVDRHNGQVIVKPVRGTILKTYFTRKITPEHLGDDASIRLSPAMYQEYIPGNTHLRVHCFGNNQYTAKLDSPDLDWRENLDIPLAEADTSIDLREKIRTTLDILKLKMGVIDIKIDNEGEAVWLEVNAQGQFLFVEGLADMQLMDRFVDFIISEIE